MDSDEYFAQVRLRPGVIVRATITLRPVRDGHQVELSMQIEEERFSAIEDDDFGAFCLVRRQLEARGWLVLCNGSSRNVFPSPMSRDMGGGVMAFVLTIGKPASMENLVHIFERTIRIDPVTVDEQERFYEQWLASSKRGRRFGLLCFTSLFSTPY